MGDRPPRMVPRPQMAPAPDATSRLPYLRPMQRHAGECLGTLLLTLFHAGAAASLRLFAAELSTCRRRRPTWYFSRSPMASPLFIIIMIVGKISGVFVNPAVTLALASAGRFPRGRSRRIWPRSSRGRGRRDGDAANLRRGERSVGHVGAVTLSASTRMLQGAAVRGFGAFVLVLTIMATAEDPRAPSGWAAIYHRPRARRHRPPDRANHRRRGQSRARLWPRPRRCALGRPRQLGRLSRGIFGRPRHRRGGGRQPLSCALRRAGPHASARAG